MSGKEGKISEKELIDQLQQQNKMLLEEYQKLRDAFQRVKLEEMSLALTASFEVIKNKEMFPEDFVQKSVSKIIGIMTPEVTE